eukprot:107288-Chlamydomonas_euryale.AAC.1
MCPDCGATGPPWLRRRLDYGTAKTPQAAWALTSCTTTNLQLVMSSAGSETSAKLGDHTPSLAR